MFRRHVPTVYFALSGGLVGEFSASWGANLTSDMLKMIVAVTVYVKYIL